MKKFMAVHKEPELSWEIVEENWRKLAKVETAEWVKTYYNQNESAQSQKRCSVNAITDILLAAA